MRKISAILLILVLFVTQLNITCLSVEVLELDTDGFYLINNADDLYAFAKLVNSGKYDINAKLTADIVLNENVLDENGDLNEGTFKQWHPIGDKNAYMDYTGSDGGRKNDNNTFQGVFDGQNYTIYGLYYYLTGNNYDDTGIGLFGTLDSGTVKNLTIRDSYFETCYTSAFICGYSMNGTIINCDVYGTVVGKYESAGICGLAESGGYTTISNCNFYGKINATVKVGGICGRMWAGRIENCSNYGKISATGVVGGIVGTIGDDAQEKSVLKCCSNYADVASTAGSSYTSAGGIVGGTENTKIEDCLNVGNISAVSTGSYTYVGGICASGLGDDEFINCLSYGKISSESPDERSRKGAIIGTALKNSSSDTYFSNNYYYSSIADVGVAQYGTSYTYEVLDSVDGMVESVSASQLKNGTVLEALNNSREDGPWGQEINKEPYPYLTENPVEYIFSIDKTTVIDYKNKVIYTERQGITDIFEIIDSYEKVGKDAITVIPAPSFMNQQQLKLYGTESYIYVYVNGPRTQLYRLVVYGDVDADSVVDVIDASDVERTVNGHKELEEQRFLAADCNSDGSITAEDFQSVVNIGMST